MLKSVEDIPYTDIRYRMDMAEEELWCLDMYFRDLWIPDNLWLSRVWKVKFTWFIDSNWRPLCDWDSIIVYRKNESWEWIDKWFIKRVQWWFMLKYTSEDDCTYLPWVLINNKFTIC